jgi:hypothetical protein
LEGESVDNDGMDLFLQWSGMAVAATMILRLALAERARIVAQLARVRVEEGYAARR